MTYKMDEIVDVIREYVKDKIEDTEKNFNAKISRIEDLLKNLNTKANMMNIVVNVKYMLCLMMQTDQLSKSVEAFHINQAKFKERLTKLEATNEFLFEMMEKKSHPANIQVEPNLNSIYESIRVLHSSSSSNLSKLFEIQSRIEFLSEKVAEMDDQFKSQLKLHETAIDSTKIMLKQMGDKYDSLCVQCSKRFGKPNTNLSKFTWRIGGIKKNLKADKYYIESEQFLIDGCSYKGKAKFEVSYGTVWTSLTFLDENARDGKMIPLKPIPKWTFILKDLSGNDKNLIRTRDILFNQEHAFGQFAHWIPLCAKTLLENACYNQNDSIVIEVELDPLQVTRLVSGIDGTLEWRIDNYTPKKQATIDGLITCDSSNYFYTSTKGYRVMVNAFLNGKWDFKDKGLTVDILFLTGEHDETLSHEFPHKTSFVLYDQMDLGKSVTVSVNENLQNKQHYVIDVLTHKEIESGRFLKDDCLYCKVVIEAGI